MFARIFFISIGIISILWIGYVALDIVDKENELTPTLIFGKEDKELLIVNRILEFNRDILPFKSTPQNEKLLSHIIPALSETRSIYISSFRSHFLVESSTPWSTKKIKKLLTSTGLTFSVKNKETFLLDNYTITFKKNYLYFQLDDFRSTKNEHWNTFDRKASVCLIHFNESEASISDIYIKGANKIEFQSSNTANLKGNQINDKDLFSMVLPNSINNYHFYEKEYFSNQDKYFRKSPMYQWNDKGFVSFIHQGQVVIISDYISGQDPINVLFEYTRKDADDVDYAQFKNIKLTSNFPKNERKGFYVYNLNDHVIISENQAICEEIIKENKLGNTLATNPALLNELFHGLPTLVTERVINNDEKFSRTIYKSKILETRLNTKSKIVEETKQNQHKSFSINIESGIADFVSFNGRGNCVVLATNGDLNYYKNGILLWKKNIPGKIVGKIQYNSASESILITCKSAIYLFDKSGNAITKIDSPNKVVTQEATSYSWKGKPYIIVPFENGEIISYDSKGKQIFEIQTGITDISNPVDVWLSQKKLFFGVRNNQVFKMFQLDKKKEFRSFTIPGKSYSIIRANELELYFIQDGLLTVSNQKGISKNLNQKINGNLYSIGDREDMYFMSRDENLVSIFNPEGKKLSSLNLSNIEFVDVKSFNGRIYISLIDELENNVYLYQLNGNSILEKPIEGSKKTSLNYFENKVLLTTIVDNYIIQYQINQ